MQKPSNLTMSSDSGIMDILRCKRRHEHVCSLFNIQQFEKTNLCNLVKDYRNINEQKKTLSSKLLQEAKELNITRRNCMKMNQLE